MLFTDENMNEPETHDIVLHFTKNYTTYKTDCDLSFVISDEV